MDPVDPGRVRRELEALLDACRARAVRAGAGAVRLKRTDDGRRELLSDLDVRVEQALRDGLRDAFPRAALFSEEADHRREALDAALCFVIDPIDGTRELLAGRSGYATSVAALAAGRPLLGMVDFPARDQRFACPAGGPVTLNGRPLAPPGGRRGDAAVTRLAVSPAQARAAVLDRVAAADPDLLLVPVGAVTGKLAQLCLGDVDAAAFLPLGGAPVALWDYLGFAVGLPALGLSLRDLAGDRDLATTRPTYWHGGWVAGTAAARRQVRAALAAAGLGGPAAQPPPSAGARPRRSSSSR